MRLAESSKRGEQRDRRSAGRAPPRGRAPGPMRSHGRDRPAAGPRGFLGWRAPAVRRIPAGALALALISSLAITPSVAAKPPLVLDQAAESPGDLYRFQWSQGSANAAGLAQTLTVGQTGVLEAVELVLSREDWTTQDLTIATRGDAPNGPWLATNEPVPPASGPV